MLSSLLHGRLRSTKYHPVYPVDHHYNDLITIIDYGQELKHWTSTPFWKCTFSEYFLLRKFCLLHNLFFVFFRLVMLCFFFHGSIKFSMYLTNEIKVF